MKRALLIILSLISEFSFGCECRLDKLSIKQKEEIKNSECIFIGEITEINKNENTFKVVVKESLDGGDSVGNSYTGKNWKYCHPYVEERGKWIIYGKTENGYLKLNLCGISRNFKNPEYLINILPPPELPEKYEEYVKSEKEGKLKEWREKNIALAKEELKKEIIALRKRRDE